MKSVDLYNFNDYRSFLNALCASKGLRSGYKKQVSSAMNIQSAYLSRVLNGQVNLNLEQALRLSQFLGMTTEDRRFFFDLIEMERAGTQELRKHFKDQIDYALKQRNRVHTRLTQVLEMSSESKAEYYSNWYYLAIHLLVDLDSVASVEDITDRLQLNIETVSSVLKFLEKHDLIRSKDGVIKPGEVSVHLPGDSPLVSQHHRNWRLKALQDVSKTDEEHLHFSAATTIDEKTYQVLREQILSTIEKAVTLFQEAPAEELYSLNIDWYKL